MRFSLFAVATALISSSLVVAKPLKGWHITNEEDISNWYNVDGTWVSKASIIAALTTVAGKKHDNSERKRVSTRGSYPHVYTNDQGPWDPIAGSSMNHGMYFEYQLGSGQRSPGDPRVAYTILGDQNPKNEKAGEKQPAATTFVGVMKHGESGGPFEIVHGQDTKPVGQVQPQVEDDLEESDSEPIKKEEEKKEESDDDLEEFVSKKPIKKTEKQTKQTTTKQTTRKTNKKNNKNFEDSDEDNLNFRKRSYPIHFRA